MNARNWLWHDHRDYEELLLACARGADAAAWAAARERLHDLVSLLKGHFLMEEEVLFPAYEGLVDAPDAPTRKLRREHDQMRDLLEHLSGAVEAQDRPRAAEVVTRLEALMSQHHEKEEEIFLPMAQHALLERREEVMERLKRLDWKHALRAWRVRTSVSGARPDEGAGADAGKRSE
jgi:iron-sulfur cluster repair protein YtfE (RIC family)